MAHASSTLPGTGPIRAGGAPAAGPPAGAPAGAARATRTGAPARGLGLAPARVAQATAWPDAWVAARSTPTLATFAKLAASPRTSGRRAYLWLGGAALVGWGVPAAASLARGGLPGWALLLAALALAALTVAWFSLAQGAAHLIARELRAPAAFARLAYPAAAFCAPLMIVAGALLAGPSPLRVLLLPLLGYGFYLEVLAIRAAHRLGWAPALLAAAPGTLLMLVPMAAVAGLALQLM